MKIDLNHISIRKVFEGYKDSAEEGVVGYHGQLNIRPAFQREFIYKPQQRDQVIQTIRKNFPLNTMYWVKTEHGNYELMDGQQRTVSFCQYVNGDFSISWDGQPRGFNNLTQEEKEQILDYELQVYICEGTDKERLDWFNIINIASVPLTKQEIRNATYTGSWLSDAKRWFSKTGCPAYAIGEKYMSGSPIRQDYLEGVLRWINNDHIEEYMAEHQNSENAAELWQYFQEVIAWIERIFPNYRKIMKGLEWGIFYNEHKNDKLNAADLEKKITKLIEDDEVEKKSGIYEYLLTSDERTLRLRTFDEKTKVKKYEEQKGICPQCRKHYEIDEMEADHIVPWKKGGKTEYKNCQMLCREDNRTKSGK